MIKRYILFSLLFSGAIITSYGMREDQQQENLQAQEALIQENLQKDFIGALHSGILVPGAAYTFFDSILSLNSTNTQNIELIAQGNYRAHIALLNQQVSKLLALIFEDQLHFRTTQQKTILYEEFERYIHNLIQNSKLFPLALRTLTDEQKQTIVREQLMPRRYLLLEHALRVNNSPFLERFLLETLRAQLTVPARRQQVMQLVSPVRLYQEYIVQQFNEYLVPDNNQNDPDNNQNDPDNNQNDPDNNQNDNILKNIIIDIVHRYALDQQHRDVLQSLMSITGFEITEAAITERVALIGQVYRLIYTRVASNSIYLELQRLNGITETAEQRALLEGIGEAVNNARADIAAQQQPIQLTEAQQRRLGARLF